MTFRTDQNYLKNVQYSNAGNLNARIQLHARFKTNPYDWFAWIFDHFELPPEAKVLELGCGPALLWSSNLSRLPAGWQITLSDLSQGMIEEARRELKEAAGRFKYEVIDAQSIPFPDASFDAVIANHMLYHVPDRSLALSEIYRVLKPAGRLYAATNGENNMSAINHLADQLSPRLSELRRLNFAHTLFTLENGVAQLARYFPVVRLENYPDSLRVTEAGPLVAYILSMSSMKEINVSQQEVERFQAALQAQIDRDGAVLIEKTTGLFIAQKS